MSRIIANLQPGIIRDPDTVLVIRFTSPLNAQNVTLTLKEMDTWRWRNDTHIEYADSADDNIAIFNGTIERRKFVAGPHLIPPAPEGSPILKVQFFGSDTIYELPIPDSTLAEEGGELEIGVHVTGEVQVRRRTVQREYQTRWPVFIRNYGTEAAQERPVLTFITGRDRGRNRFFTSGRSFWRRRADGIVDRSNIEQLLDYLGVQQNLENLGEGRYGEINIVSHANANQWMMRLFHRQAGQVNHIDVNVLNRHGSDNRLTDPGDDKIDSDTRIVIRGCVIGQNQALLNRIHTLFGGRANVYAPQYIQRYEFRGRGRNRVEREYFVEFYFFYNVGRQIPSNATCLQKLKEKYPQVGIDDVEWRRLLQGAGERDRVNSRPERFRLTIEYNDSTPPTQRAERMAELERQWEGGDATYHTTTEDWSWTFVPQARGPARNRTYRLICNGIRRRIEVRRPYRDINGDLVVPNLYDTNHYGRSPAPGWE